MKFLFAYLVLILWFIAVVIGHHDAAAVIFFGWFNEPGFSIGMVIMMYYAIAVWVVYLQCMGESPMR